MFALAARYVVLGAPLLLLLLLLAVVAVEWLYRVDPRTRLEGRELGSVAVDCCEFSGCCCPAEDDGGTPRRIMRGDSDRLGKLRARGLSLRSDTPHRLLVVVVFAAADAPPPPVDVDVVTLRSFSRPRAAAFAAAILVEVSGWREVPEEVDEDEDAGTFGAFKEGCILPADEEGRGESPSSPRRGFWGALCWEKFSGFAATFDGSCWSSWRAVNSERSGSIACSGFSPNEAGPWLARSGAEPFDLLEAVKGRDCGAGATGAAAEGFVVVATAEVSAVAVAAVASGRRLLLLTLLWLLLLLALALKKGSLSACAVVKRFSGSSARHRSSKLSRAPSFGSGNISCS